MSRPDASHNARRERIEQSPQYQRGAFRNPSGATPRLAPGTTLPVMRDFVFHRGERRPAAPLPTLDPRAAWMQPIETGLRVTWLGHSTLLVEIDGVRLLTDPVWAERASPVGFVGPRRFQPMPVELDALGRVDAVLVSHDHFDHLDRITVCRLARSGAAFVTSLGVGAHLEAWGIEPAAIVELDWWERTEVRGESASVEIVAAPAQHFSGRGLGDRNQTLWSSFAIRGRERSFYFGADSGLMDAYVDIGSRLGPFDAVALEIGAFHPAWQTIHLGPENALLAHARIGSGALLPIHWGTFDLAIHDWHEPIESLLAGAQERSVQVLTPRIGEPFEPRHERSFGAWWRDAMRVRDR